MKGETFKIGEIAYYLGNKKGKWKVGKAKVVEIITRESGTIYHSVNDTPTANYDYEQRDGFTNILIHKKPESILTNIKQIIEADYINALDNYEKIKKELNL
jgi:hypothetical protein